MATVFKIDIDQILHSKAGNKARYVPRFLVEYLKKIVHQDEINGFMESVGDLQGIEWIERVLDFLDVKSEVYGLENLPSDNEDTRFTFVSNHPLGGPDGIIIGQILGRKYNGRIKYLVNDLLMNLHGLAPSVYLSIRRGSKAEIFRAL